jgi:hypothetical protein
MTSPLSSDAMIGTADGAWARISDRIIDCPVSVMLSTGGCAWSAIPMIDTTTRQAAVSQSRPLFDLVAICFLLQAGILENTR